MTNISFLLYMNCILILCGLMCSNTRVNAVQVDRFWSVLDGNQEIPPNRTYAHGFIGLKFTEDSSKLVYNVNVNDIDNITGIYLYSTRSNPHYASMVLDLLKEAKEVKVKSNNINVTKVNQYDVEGTVAIGGVTSGDLQGELKGNSLKDLRKLMMDGGVYVSVQTKEFPLGEIRGEEFIPIDRIFPDISDFQWD
ncbi:MAG: CHRD domain-containing protein [Thaumarchaeota archaeon]|nr:MAG: CHRD domain-containing protein [Nitrososphaerota archaeon]